ncbi:AAA family ATPase [Hydrocarboniphaga effusa]|uniref:AAA family ATPase n=1 Tax=Hydrocarboniphaga effusa TaxID=243629 RepID=UPI003BABD2B5
MHSMCVGVKNVMRLSAAGTSLSKRSPGMPGIGLIHGPTGYGKTKSVDWYANKTKAHYVRAWASWTPAGMLGDICKELTLPAGGSLHAMSTRIVERLTFSQKALFIDEADYVVDSKRMRDITRDLHDMSGVPIVLIGMDEIEQKLACSPQFTGRVSQNVKFEPLDLADARKIADTLCEVQIADDLLRKIFTDANGACRNIIVSLGEAENIGKSRALKSVALADLGNNVKLFTGAAPQAAA